ncbi:paraneoplastic antigen Ma1 homolog [Pseudorasbora parva]|uniref:paraneoplastic antigen Ma1 homolog n=1 Tax=Pseudorasbora parva TaxID=51549 RepID=UPI00351DE70C
MAEFRNWCRGEGIDPAHAVMISRVPEDSDVAHIEETMGMIKALGRVRVRGKVFKPEQSCLNVLCECRERVDAAVIPPEIVPLSGGNAWMITVVNEENETNDPDSFTEKLSRLLREEGKTWEDFQAIQASKLTSGDSPESIIRAVGELLEKTARPIPESSAYRRLRTLSGVSPTPVGEESLDSWSNQARLMIEECECSNKEKRRRIVESLKGPALEIIQAVRMTNPNASPMEYIEALESVFGTAESGEDLYFSFRLLRQHPGELLSAFLSRVERSLTKVLQKGGLESTLADKARVEQLIRGATESEILLLRLRLRERKTHPPTFLQLLNEIREEEEQDAARHKLSAPVRRPHVRTAQISQPVNLEESELSNLRTEIKDLRLMVRELSTPGSATPTVLVNSSSVTAPKKPAKADQNSEVQALRKQVKELQTQLTTMAVKSANDWKEPKTQSVDTSSSSVIQGRSTFFQDPDDFFVIGVVKMGILLQDVVFQRIQQR